MDAAEAFERLKKQGIIPDVIACLEGIFGPLIEEYLSDNGKGRGAGGSKAFKDAVWGMIDLTGPEVLIADSPPLQRLRRVRQLGFGYLTYPSAGYSRFEHTLGAVHQTERMVLAIRRRSKSNLHRDIDESLSTVRLAALLHDCGHMPGSHVSERFFDEKECPQADLRMHAAQIQSDLAQAFKLPPEVRLAECLSVCMAAMPSFYDLLRNEARYEPEAIATAALAIAGKAAEPSHYFVSQLISNAIDADKLDYMFRDSLFTRVPLAIDLERLLYKLKCEEVSASDLAPTTSRGLPKDSRPRVLATDTSGDLLAYDVSQTREMLYSRVYFHHKTRAAERVALELLGRRPHRPEELLAFDDGFFVDERTPRSRSAKKLARRLAWRRLPRRAFAISDYFLDPSPEQLRVEWVGLDEDLADPARRQALEKAIEAECAAIAKLLKCPRPEAVHLDPRAEHPTPGGSSLLVSLPDGSVSTGQGYAPDAAAETQDPTDSAHVFFSGADAEAELVYVAAERILAREFDLYFTRDAADQAKVNWEKVIDLKRNLEEAHPQSFEDYGRLRARPLLVDDASLDGQIASIAKRFQHYTTVPQVMLTEERVRDFLAQFPEPLVEPMLEALEKIEFLDRGRLGTDFAASLMKQSPTNAVFVPLTSGYAKSASHIPYFLSDHRGSLPFMSLEEALKTDRPLVVFDDVLVSGTQSTKILNTWLGERKPPYRGVPVLGPDQRQALRERSVRFHFAWAWHQGVERLAERQQVLQLDAEVGAMVIDESGPALNGISNSEALRAFLREVGKSVLMTTKGQRGRKPWSEEKCERSALGYNNDERLVVIEYNTPTGTITPLWSSGTFRNADWTPLFPRRQRSGSAGGDAGQPGEALAGEG